MEKQLIIVCLFTLIIHASETLSYAVRLAGIRIGRLAVALSLTGMIVLVSRTSNLIQAPMMGGLVDAATREGDSGHLVTQFRLILGASSLGTMLAIMLFPTFVFLSARVISRLEITGSIPLTIKHSLTVQNLKKAGKSIRLPGLNLFARLRLGGVPNRLMLLNCLVTSIYTVGVLSTLYAVLIMPNLRTAASMSSGLINGIATIIFTLLIDPRVAVMTDKALSGKASIESINKMFAMLMLSRLAGTILAQLLLVPAAYWLKWVLPLFLSR